MQEASPTPESVKGNAARGGPRASASVVVCTRLRPAELSRCLAAVSRLGHPDFEVVVVDNTSGDPAARELAEQHHARYLSEPLPGLSRARNAGSRAANGELVAFIDDDAVPDPDWLTRHTEVLSDRSLAASTGRVLPLPLQSEPAKAYRHVEDFGAASFRVDRSAPDWFTRANFRLGVGPNMVFRRELFRNGWGFRESLGLGTPIPGGEEAYAFFSLVKHGHAIAYVPDAVVHHSAPATMEALAQRERRIVRGSSGYLFALLVEERDHRGDVVRYVLRGMRGRNWDEGTTRSSRSNPRWMLIAVALPAPMRYLKARLKTSASNPSPVPGVGA